MTGDHHGRFERGPHRDDDRRGPAGAARPSGPGAGGSGGRGCRGAGGSSTGGGGASFGDGRAGGGGSSFGDGRTGGSRASGSLAGGRPPLPADAGPIGGLALGHDPGLPILLELEGLVREAAVAASAAAGAVAGGAVRGSRPAVADHDTDRRPGPVPALRGGRTSGEHAPESRTTGRRAGGSRASEGRTTAKDRGGSGTSEGRTIAKGRSGGGTSEGRTTAKGRAGTRWTGGRVGRLVPRGAILALLVCTVGATATALTRNGGPAANRHDGPTVTVAHGSAGSARWRLQVARRDGRLCVTLTATGATVSGAAVDPDCQAVPGRRVVVPRTVVTADRLIVHGLAGRAVRAVSVTADGVARTSRTVPVSGAEGVRAFVVVLRRRPAPGRADVEGSPPLVRPLGHHDRPLGPAQRDCSAASCTP